MTSDPTTWTDLKTRLADWAGDRADSNIDTLCAEAVALSERRFQRMVFCPEREATTTLTATTNTVALPADFWGVKTIYVDAANDTVLIRMTSPELHTAYPSGTTGTPANYAIEGENLILGPTPSGSTSIKLTYFQTIPALSGSQATNWLLTDHPDLYLFAALADLFLLFDDPRSATFEGRFQETLEEVNRSGRRRTSNSGPLCATSGVSNISGIQA